jgi:hypothetical protein
MKSIAAEDYDTPPPPKKMTDAARHKDLEVQEQTFLPLYRPGHCECINNS